MPGFEPFGKSLIFAGIFIILLGMLLTFWHKIPLLGRLQGDVFFQKGNFSFFVPVVTCLVISLFLTIVINVVIRLIGK